MQLALAPDDSAEETHLDAKVLIVDDQKPNVLLLKKTLALAGYKHLVTTTDPTEVLGLQQKQDFDIILLDIRMPKLDGFGVMSLLNKNKNPDDYVPVLVLTAQIDRETKIKALEHGAKDFVTKPFDQVEVLNRMKNMLEVRLLHQQVKNQNQELEKRVLARTKELRETRLEIVRRLGLAAEYRDNETGLHIIRMSQFSRLLALEIGFSAQEADLLLNAAPMHDIGKLGIPDRVLLKPGKLDAEEWKIMQSHAEIGAKILQGHRSSLLKLATSIARSHHEKWDGSGYPDGLVGAKIPVGARIVAVADVFDALTSKRPYKEPWPVEKAIAELERSAGSHFEPRLVEAFKRILPDVLEVKEKYAEPD